jgi:hypothetical protein
VCAGFYLFVYSQVNILFQNRIALLKKEEERAWRKIQQTKKRADEILAMRRENERRIEQKQLMSQQVGVVLDFCTSYFFLVV